MFSKWMNSICARNRCLVRDIFRSLHSNFIKSCLSRTSETCTWPSPSQIYRSTTSRTLVIIWAIWLVTKAQGVFSPNSNLKVRFRCSLFGKVGKMSNCWLLYHKFTCFIFGNLWRCHLDVHALSLLRMGEHACRRPEGRGQRIHVFYY